MAQNDLFKRYLDAGLAFTALTQARAEALVKDWVKAGEVQADQAREAVSDLLERSRQNSERLLTTVREEVRSQVTTLGLASQADLDRIEARISALIGSVTTPAEQAVDLAKQAAGPAKEAVAKAAKVTQQPPARAAGPAKKAAKKKAPATKKAPTTKKAPPAKKKAPAKKAPGKKA
jgi:polyhydroxyalkanoate synthesis regulator phasin